jgi:hypothetical protein
MPHESCELYPILLIALSKLQMQGEHCQPPDNQWPHLFSRLLLLSTLLVSLALETWQAPAINTSAGLQANRSSKVKDKVIQALQT